MKTIFTTLFIGCLLQFANAQNISGVVNTYRKVLWADSASGRVKLSDVSGFAGYNGRKVLLMQMKGATMNSGSSISDASFGTITSIGSAGYYEVATICGFLNDTVVFERKLNNFYDINGHVQCIIMPSYSTATVTDTLKAARWDAAADTGGVVAIEVTGTLYLNKPIYASGLGFRGGTYTKYGGTCSANPVPPVTDYYMPYAANGLKTGGRKGEGLADFVTGREYARGKQSTGGGGGNNHNGGGAGGANYGAGGDGGNRITTNFGECASSGAAKGGESVATYGYASTPATRNRIFMGGGGGAGHDNDGYGLAGGHGGGIVFIIANRIEGASATAAGNAILANGEVPGRFLPAPLSFYSNASSSDGAGGGGAGGTIVLLVNSYGGNSITAEAKGGRGGNSEVGNNNQCSGPGGGGGGGVIWYSSALSGITTNVAGGLKGITTSGLPACNGQSNGAVDGGAGLIQAGFQLAAPRDSSPVCKGLVALRVFSNISGYREGNICHITLTLDHAMPGSRFILQRFNTDGSIADGMQLAGNNSSTYHFTDMIPQQPTQLYRVKILLRDGDVQYSDILNIRAARQNRSPFIDIFPNPAKTTLGVQVYLKKAGLAKMEIIDTMGKSFWIRNRMLNRGGNAISISLDQLPEGSLFFKLTVDNEMTIRPFLKLSQ